jgi:transposase
LPKCFGSWQSLYHRFRAWTRSGLWTCLLGGLAEKLRDDEAVMIDSTAMRVHAHGANPAG